jgi:hypothetical protein
VVALQTVWGNVEAHIGLTSIGILNGQPWQGVLGVKLSVQLNPAIAALVGDAFTEVLTSFV